MDRRELAALVVLALAPQQGRAAEEVKAGGRTRYATVVEGRVGNRPVPMALTGTAVRTRYGFTVYTIGSYLQVGAVARDAEGLAAVDAPKILRLVFERGVDGDTMGRSFTDSLGLNYPAPAFAAELAQLTRFMKTHPVVRGENVWLTYIPG